MATEAFVIAITTTGTREVQRDLSNIGTAGDSASKQIDAVGAAAKRTSSSVDALRGSLALMRNMLVAFSFVRAISGIAELGNEAILMQNKLVTITRSTDEMKAAMQALADVSIRTRTDLDTNVDTFVRMARSTGALHLSYRQLVDMTETIAATVHIAGASTAQASRALMDFAEGLAAGSLQGRQLRAMIMQLPTLGDAIGKSFGLAGAQLMHFLQKNPGALTPEAIIKSLQAVRPEMMRLMNATEVTIGQAFQNLHSKILLFVQDMDATMKISQKVGIVLDWVGNHIDFLGRFAAFLLAIGAASIAVSVVTALVTSLGFLGGVVNVLLLGLPKLAFNLIMLPFRAVASLVAVLEAAFIGLAAAVRFVQTVVVSMRAAFVAAGAIITLIQGIITGTVTLTTVWSMLLEAVMALISSFTVMLPILIALGVALWGAGSAVLGFLAPLMQLAAVADPFKSLHISLQDLPDLFSAVFDTIVQEWPKVMEFMGALWRDMINGLRNHFGSFVNDTLIGMPKSVPAAIRNFLGISKPGDEQNYQFMPTNLPTNTASPIINELAQDAANRFIARKNAKPATDQNEKLLAGTPNVVIGKPLDEADPQKIANATAALEGFLKQYSNYAAAEQKMAQFDKLILSGMKAKIDSLRIINDAGIKANSIAEARQKIEVLVLRDVVGVGNADFKAAQELDQLNKARDKGVLVNNEYARSLLKITEARLTANPTDMSLGISVARQKSDVAVAASGTIAEGIVGSALSYQTQSDIAGVQVAALNAALADGTIKGPAYAHAMEEVLKSQHDLASGEAYAALHAQNELLDQGAIAASALSKVYENFNAGQKVALQIQAINDAIAKNPELMEEGTKAIRDLEISLLSTQEDALSGFQRGMLEAQKDLNDFASTAATTVKQAFTDLNETITDFFMTGSLSISKLADDLQRNLVKLAVQQTITGPLSNWMSEQGGLFGQGGFFGSLFGGSGLAGALGGGAKLGSSASNPMYVAVVPGLGAGLGLSGSTGANGYDLFSNGGLFSSSGFFVNLFSGTGGGEGSTSSSILGALGEFGSLFGFATGGDFTVGGQGGTDSQTVAFRATPGELVSVRRPGDSNGGGSRPIAVTMNVMGAQDPDTFRRSAGQVASSLTNAIARAKARNGI